MLTRGEFEHFCISISDVKTGFSSQPATILLKPVLPVIKTSLLLASTITNLAQA